MRRSPARRSVRPLGAGVSMLVIALAILSIPVAVADDLALSAAQTAAWILALYSLAGISSLVVVARYRQPLILTGNVFVLIFLSQLGGRIPWPELVGASMLAGALVLVLGPLGLTDRLAAWLPAPVVFGLLAGAVLPFFTDLFTQLGRARILLGGTLVAYLLGRRFLEPRLPAILPALVVGTVLAAAGVGGGITLPAGFTPPVAAVTLPELSLRAVLTATPVMVVFITLQANVASIAYLRSQGFAPPERAVEVISGAGTAIGSLLGPVGLSLSLPATAICAGPEAGAREVRHRAVYLAGAGAVVLGLLAAMTRDVASVIPEALLSGVVGLAVVGVLASAVQRVVQGPLLLGPIFAFGISLSDLSMFGLGPFFWALAGGVGVARFLEPEGWRALTAPAPDGAQDS